MRKRGMFVVLGFRLLPCDLGVLLLDFLRALLKVRAGLAIAPSGFGLGYCRSVSLQGRGMNGNCGQWHGAREGGP